MSTPVINPNWVELPGPGTYNPPNDERGHCLLGDAPSYTMGARNACFKPDVASPGPVYSPRFLTPRSQGSIGDAPLYSFGGSERFPPEAQKAPGPGHYAQECTYKGGTMLGDAPAYGFGSSAQRECSSPNGRGKRFISHEHALKSNYGDHSPGPLVYNIQDSFGCQCSGSGQLNSPRYSMRSRVSNYTPGASPAKQAQPGPGSYSQTAGFGNQVASGRSTAPTYAFGTSQRYRPEFEPKKILYMGKAYERQSLGIHSPGPSTYGALKTFGPGSNVGRIRTTPSYSFGVESRF